MCNTRSIMRGVAALTVVALVCSSGAGTAVAQQQAARSSLFREADQALERVQDARADILAPRSYAEGVKRYEEAERDFERGRSAADIGEKLGEAADHFERAIAAAQLAYPTLSSALAARDDAEAAEALN